MSAPVTVAPAASYRNATPYPFCPGCGHGAILDQLDAALGRLGLEPRRVAIVSDIGCSGLSDQYFDTHAFHGLHGRSLTYATGLKLARPELTVIVVMGDGGTGIGGAHLLSAARRNLDLTLLVFDNFNFGMTGGQHSATTPTGALTSTTPLGNLERPLDLCATVAAAGATWAWRGTSFDADLGERIAEAIAHPGFAMLDVWEPCSAHYASRNRLTRKAITELVASLGFATGLVRRVEAPEYGAACRAANAGGAPASSVVSPRALAPNWSSVLDRRFRLVLAGSAGGRVGTASRLIGRAALLAGLHAALRSDYPVTVRSGYSVAEIVLDPQPIDDAAVESADALVVLAPEGRRQAIAYSSAMAPDAPRFAVPRIEALAVGQPFRIVDPAAASIRLGRDWIATAVAAALALKLDLLPIEALRAAAAEEPEHAKLELALAAAAELAARP